MNRKHWHLGITLATLFSSHVHAQGPAVDFLTRVPDIQWTDGATGREFLRVAVKLVMMRWAAGEHSPSEPALQERLRRLEADENELANRCLAELRRERSRHTSRHGPAIGDLRALHAACSTVHDASQELRELVTRTGHRVDELATREPRVVWECDAPNRPTEALSRVLDDTVQAACWVTEVPEIGFSRVRVVGSNPNVVLDVLILARGERAHAIVLARWPLSQRAPRRRLRPELLCDDCDDHAFR